MLVEFANLRKSANWSSGVTCRDNSGYHEAGNTIIITDDAAMPTYIAALKAEAESVLVPGTRYEIRRSVPINGRPELRQGVAWCWERKNARGTDAEWLAEQPGPRDGYILVERCITPC